MRRRNFLKSVLGFLALPTLPKSKAKGISGYELVRKVRAKVNPGKSTESVKWRKWAHPKVLKWKASYVNRIIYDNHICILKLST